MSLERRALFPEEESAAGPGRYGCPMLVRARFFLPGDNDRPHVRCSLGWALHGENEVAWCMATEVLTDCWKVHPERISAVVVTTEPDEPMELAGD